ncbi:MAG: hypothetical protein NTW29_18825, partial [Bacteroidetes bacterium]|nr:hypothetical protein [Bacteroidota bacterium]
KEISINPGKQIRWFVPDTTSNMAGMELFTGHKHSTAALDLAYRKKNNGRDTASISDRREIINWVAEKQPFNSSYIKTNVKVLDLKDNPYRTRETKNGIVGKFHISNNPKIGRRELAQQLKDKYGYYKVKIRNWRDGRNLSYRKSSPITGSDFSVSYDDVGDSAWIDSKLAARYKLKATDTISYAVSDMSFMQTRNSKNVFATINLNALANRYSVDINTLGWINCDRFYRNNGPKTDYYINIADTASNYYTILVFDKMKSMMMGYTSGNRVIFPNLPVGVKAKVLCVGIKEGKSVAALANLADVGNGVDQLKFEETSPASFREQAAMIDK